MTTWQWLEFLGVIFLEYLYTTLSLCLYFSVDFVHDGPGWVPAKQLVDGPPSRSHLLWGFRPRHLWVGHFPHVRLWWSPDELHPAGDHSSPHPCGILNKVFGLLFVVAPNGQNNVCTLQWPLCRMPNITQKCLICSCLYQTWAKCLFSFRWKNFAENRSLRNSAQI